MRRLLSLALTMALAAAVLTEMEAPASAHSFGEKPKADALLWAKEVTRCKGLSAQKLAAVMLAPTWPETGAGTSAAPSPMTLSRWDVHENLYSFGKPNNKKRAFWHPGIGMWQLDSAGLGAPFAAHQRMSSYQSAKVAAETMAAKYCATSGTAAERRAAAWGPWHACSSGICESLYKEHFCWSTKKLCNITVDSSVKRRGGVKKRTCYSKGSPTKTFTCWYVKPGNAQGHTGWQYGPLKGNYPNGPAPLAFPFYSYGSGGSEFRHWIKADTGYKTAEIHGRRTIGVNARNGLQWVSGGTLCDKTKSRGAC